MGWRGEKAAREEQERRDSGISSSPGYRDSNGNLSGGDGWARYSNGMLQGGDGYKRDSFGNILDKNGNVTR